MLYILKSRSKENLFSDRLKKLINFLIPIYAHGVYRNSYEKTCNGFSSAKNIDVAQNLCFALFTLFTKSRLKLFFLFLKARFTQQCEHVILICFNSRLIKGINSQKISADATGFFEEIYKISEIVFI